VAPLTDAMEYVLASVGHTLAGPVIVAGVAGGLVTVTVKVCAAELPQVFFATTEIFPLFALAVVLIVSVDELPVQPPGKVHV
jgi:hypothetical protein